MVMIRSWSGNVWGRYHGFGWVVVMVKVSRTSLCLHSELAVTHSLTHWRPKVCKELPGQLKKHMNRSKCLIIGGRIQLLVCISLVLIIMVMLFNIKREKFQILWWCWSWWSLFCIFVSHTFSFQVWHWGFWWSWQALQESLWIERTLEATACWYHWNNSWQ